MSRPEAMDALGLTHRTIVTVAAGGVIRYVKGPDRNFPARCFFFLREDVIRIEEAFEKHSVSPRAYSSPGEFIALRHAMKNYLGHGPALAAVISATVDGRLVPADTRTGFQGLLVTCSAPRISVNTARRPALRRHPKAFSVSKKRQPC
jgi:hypothetical protein